MKKILFAISFGVILSSSLLFTGCNGCKEIGPNINLTPAAYVDSFYTLTSSQITSLTTDAHNVLVEEFTGQTCSNCPSAHTTLEGISAANKGRINIIGLYLFGIPQANPPAGYTYDLRDSDATQIGNKVYGGVAALPSGGVDRMQTSTGAIITDRSTWADNISTQLTKTDSVNLTLQSSYNATTMMAKISATVTYTNPMSAKQNLTVVIVEDSMVDLQEFPPGAYPGGFDPNYIFTNVCRGIVSAVPFGDPVLDTVAVKAKGRAVKRTFNYKLKTTIPAIKPAHCRVIAFINSTSGTDLHILQSAQTKLTP